jgi:hypothetical protein
MKRKELMVNQWSNGFIKVGTHKYGYYGKLRQTKNNKKISIKIKKIK